MADVEPAPAEARVAIGISEAQPEVTQRARQLAEALALPLIRAGEPDDATYDLYLTVTPKRLELREPPVHQTRPLYIDFVRGSVGSRRANLSGRQPIARAVGKRGRGYIVDATAGLGRDTFLLACLGHRVVAIERSPTLVALLADGLGRALAEGDTALKAAIDHITLMTADARESLAEMKSEPPDVIYLDPMYPERKKAALPQKEMRILRALVGDDPDAGVLLHVARRTATRRVVVKRHIHAPPLADDPQTTITGRRVRYDVYLTGHSPAGNNKTAI